MSIVQVIFLSENLPVYPFESILFLVLVTFLFFNPFRPTGMMVFDFLFFVAGFLGTSSMVTSPPSRASESSSPSGSLTLLVLVDGKWDTFSTSSVRTSFNHVEIYSIKRKYRRQYPSVPLPHAQPQSCRCSRRSSNWAVTFAWRA